MEEIWSTRWYREYPFVSTGFHASRVVQRMSSINSCNTGISISWRCRRFEATLSLAVLHFSCKSNTNPTQQHDSIPTNTTTPTRQRLHNHTNPTQHKFNTTSTPEPSIQAPGTSTMPVRRDLGPHQIIGIRKSLPPSLSWISSWCHLILILIEDIGWIYPPTQDESHHQDYLGSESLWKLHSGLVPGFANAHGNPQIFAVPWMPWKSTLSRFHASILQFFAML